MASSYLQKKEREFQMEAEQEKRQASENLRPAFDKINSNYKGFSSYEDMMPIGCGTSVVLFIIVFFVLNDFFMYEISVGGFFKVIAGFVAASFVLAYLMQQWEISAANQHNARQDRKQQDVKAQEAVVHQQIDEKYKHLMEQETLRFQNSIKASRMKYGGKSVAMPIVKWISDQFEVTIRQGDRRPHLKTIQIPFIFDVSESAIYVKKWIFNGHSGAYGKAEEYNFTIHRFTTLPDFEDRVGFAQAMAKMVQFEIMRRFPRDPVAPTAAKPVVTISSDDTQMMLTYEVINPNYQHAVQL